MQVRPPERAKDVPFAGSRAREKTCKIDALHMQINSDRCADDALPGAPVATKGIVRGVAGAEVSSGNTRVWRDAPRCRRDHVRLRGRQSRLIQSGIAYARRLTGKAASAAWSGAVQLSPRPRCGRSGVSVGSTARRRAIRICGSSPIRTFATRGKKAMSSSVPSLQALSTRTVAYALAAVAPRSRIAGAESPREVLRRPSTPSPASAR